MRRLRQGFAIALLTLAPPTLAQEAPPPGSVGKRLFAARCALCHATDGRPGQGPGLGGVVGRVAGSTGFAYSTALRNAGFRWDAAHLDRFLADPRGTVPGTTMPVAVPEVGERKAIIDYLATLPAPASTSSTQSASAEPAVAKAATPETDSPLLTGRAAFGDWHADAPGVRRRIVAADLPAPYATQSAGNGPSIVRRPAGRVPQAPPGFRVDLFADGLDNPRVLRVAPNGDVFLAETAAGAVKVLRAPAGATHVASITTFTDGLDGPFGIAFYPPGPTPRFVYVAEENRLLRFPYRLGDRTPAGPPTVVVDRLAPSTGGHSTRDLAFSPDGSRLFVSVGSASNVAQSMPAKTPTEAEAWDRARALGAAWGAEQDRADVLSFTPDGGDRRIVATGLRNCVGLAVHPATGDLWCSTNERDGLGDDLVPDYVTRVRPGAYYGWPWYYVGDHEEPRLKGQRPDLQGRMTDPDVLLQAHSASLGLTFYDAPAFPPAYRGDGFAAEHGSWNRSRRTGYKVIRIRLKDGVPTGEYDDFLTGFVVDDGSVWGRPVGIAVTHDGALLVAEDGNDTIWRVAAEPAGQP